MLAGMVTSAFELPDHEIVENKGIVRGIVVRSRSAVGNMFAGFQILVGGNITVYANMCEQARKDAYQIMCRQAEGNGANAIVAMRYDATEVRPGVTEVLCYGTAVVAQHRSS